MAMVHPRTEKPIKVHQHKSSASRNASIRDKVNNILKLAAKLYPDRVIDLYISPKADINARAGELIYCLATAPKGAEGRDAWKLTQVGQLDTMARYMYHETNAGSYRKV